MAVDRRVQWLGATLIIGVVAVMAARSVTETPPDAGAARGRATQPRANAPTPETAAPVTVNLESLKRERESPGDAQRDPFRFRPRAEPPPAATRIPGVADDQVDAPPPPPRVPTGPPPPPPITLKFIGLVQKADGTKFAVLSDGKGPPMSGTEGEDIDGRYRILKIGTESLEIAYIDGRGRTTLRLTGQ